MLCALQHAMWGSTTWDTEKGHLVKLIKECTAELQTLYTEMDANNCGQAGGEFCDPWAMAKLTLQLRVMKPL